jgi:DNA invertase Pin-like site-specific DNA recombinase
LSTISIFNEFGCAFISTADGVNTEVSSPLGRLQLQLLGVISAFEKDLIRERVISGIRAAQAKGTILGRPALQKSIKDRMRNMLAERFKETVIASECGVSVASVYKMKKLAVVSETKARPSYGQGILSD